MENLSPRAAGGKGEYSHLPLPRPQVVPGSPSGTGRLQETNLKLMSYRRKVVARLEAKRALYQAEQQLTADHIAVLRKSHVEAMEALKARHQADLVNLGEGGVIEERLTEELVNTVGEIRDELKEVRSDFEQSLESVLNSISTNKVKALQMCKSLQNPIVPTPSEPEIEQLESSEPDSTAQKQSDLRVNVMMVVIFLWALYLLSRLYDRLTTGQ
jgi:hypothetical protein